MALNGMRCGELWLILFRVQACGSPFEECAQTTGMIAAKAMNGVDAGHIAELVAKLVGLLREVIVVELVGGHVRVTVDPLKDLTPTDGHAAAHVREALEESHQ